MAINQSVNKATTQFHAWVPQMPGYSDFKDKSFADMRTPEEQIWWLYAHIMALPDTDEYNKLKAQISKLFELYNQLVEQGFDKYYEELQKELESWFTENAWQIYKLLAKQVFFGLTDDGYFCAYVPESWGEIQFDTGAVFGRSDYGRLCLKFQPDPAAQGVIDNTYSYSLNDLNITNDMLAKVDSLIADLEVNSKRTDSTFDTLFTNLDSPVAAAQGRKQTDKSLTKDGENI